MTLRAALLALTLCCASCAWYPTPTPERQDFHGEREYETWRLHQGQRRDADEVQGSWRVIDAQREIADERLDLDEDGTYRRGPAGLFVPGAGEAGLESGGYLVGSGAITFHAQREGAAEGSEGDPRAVSHRNVLYQQMYRLEEGLLRLGDFQPLGRRGLATEPLGADYERAPAE